MEKSNVKARFSIYGENFEPGDITKQLGIIPTETYKKGELSTKYKIPRKETAWSISTGYEASMDINDQLNKILLLIEDKADKLVEIKDRLRINMLFMFVVNIVNNEKPAMYFEKRFIHFASKIDAEIGFDTYIYSQTEGEL